MISQVKPNAVQSIHMRIQSTRGQMNLADPSHPSSNPLILEMSQCAGCEATGQRAPIRTMAGFDASRGDGGQKVKENGTISSHSALNTTHGLAGPYLSTCGRYLGEGPGPGAQRVHPCQSRSLAVWALGVICT